MSYRYWIIRFVPDVARGEFTNIGIICGRDGADWSVEFDVRSIRGHGHLARDLRELSGWMTWFKDTVRATGKNDKEDVTVDSSWLRHLQSRQANAIQFSESLPVDVTTAEEGVALLLPHLVERLPARRQPNPTRRLLRSRVRSIFTSNPNFIIGENFFAGPRLQVGKQRGSFDFLRYETSERQPVTNVWSFNATMLDTLERDIQSWNYLVDRFREDGARVTVDTQDIDRTSVSLNSDSPIEVVYDPPTVTSEPRRTEIFEAALEAWEMGGVTMKTLRSFEKDMAVS